MISAPVLVLYLVLGICWMAAIVDIRTMTIPNYFPLAVIAIFVLVAPWSFGSLAGFAWQFAAFALAFIGGFVIYMTGTMGGGDVKLFAALGFWMLLENFIIWIFLVTFSGLIITFGQIIFLSFKLKSKEEISLKTAIKKVLKKEMPYGPAIALGTTLTYLLLP